MRFKLLIMINCIKLLKYYPNHFNRIFRDIYSFLSFYKPTGIALLTLFFAPINQVYSQAVQFPKPSSVSLYVDDEVPEEIYQQSHRTINLKTGELSDIKLEDHRSKLIILDFWASWCMPCLGSLDHLNAIRETLNSSEVLVLPVSYQEPEEMSAIIERFGWSHESIYGDTILRKYFPHPGLPHMVWINDGRVHSMPMITYATSENIQKVSRGAKVQMIETRDVKFLDYYKPLLGNEGVETELKFQDDNLTIAGYIYGFAETEIQRTDTQDSIFIHIVNSPLEKILYEVFYSKISRYMVPFVDAINVKVDSSRMKYFLSSRPGYSVDANYQTDVESLAWDRKQRMTIDFRIPKNIPEGKWGARLRSSLSEYVASELGMDLNISETEARTYPVMTSVASEEKIKELFQRPLAPELNDDLLRYPPHRNNRGKWNSVVSFLMDKVVDQELDYHTITDHSDLKDFEGLRFEIPKVLFDKKELKLEEVIAFVSSYGMTIKIESAGLPFLSVVPISKNNSKDKK